MKILFTGYVNVPQFDDPYKWLSRIKGYIGILEELAKIHCVVSIEQINYSGSFIEKKVEYRFLNFKKKRNYFPFGLHSFIKKQNPDVIIIHSFDFPLQVLLLKITLKKRVKFIIQNHAEKPATGLKQKVQQLADKFIDAYIFTSVEMGTPWTDQKIIKDEKKIWGIMEASSFFKPIDKNVAVQKTNAKQRKNYLFVGRLDENKDPLIVIKAFLRFQKKERGAHLYMIYHTTELLSEIETILSKENNNAAITLVGKVEHDEMIYWYNCSDFIISASHYEGSGVAICEAMSCGCIPILTNIASFKKLTAEGFCGILYSPRNADLLFDALIQTTKMNIEEERKKVLDQFNNDLSFKAIANQIDSKISSLF